MLNGPRLIAVVDDEASVRSALERLIRAAGFEVETFACAADFLSTLERRRPHCVLLDLRMPQINGFDVQQALQHVDALLPVLVLTGDDSPDSHARALRHGACAFLHKPVDDALLIGSIESALASSPPPTAS
jgi:two-component system response regulator FixJ